MNLRSKLKCENLRETLIANCNRGDFQTLAEGLKVFSDGEIGQIGDAYTCIDHYCEANDISRRDMFVAFIVELGEHGFFEDQKTKEEIKDTLMNLGLDQVLGNFKTFFQDIYNQVKQYDFGSAIKTALLNGFDLAMSAINLGQKIVFPIAVALDIPGIVYEGTGDEVYKNQIEIQKKRLESDRQFLQDLQQGVVNATPGFEQANENMGTAGATRLKEGLQNGKPAIEEVSKKISEALIAVFGEPAGKTVALGMQTSLNLAYGLESKEFEVQNAAASISKAVLDVLGATVKQTINIGANLALNLANGMNSQKSKLKTVATNLAAAAATGLRSSASSSGGAETQTISNGRTRIAIPKLAQGGVLSTPSIVEVGEYIGARSNPEIVAPQNIMYDTVVEANRPMVVVINQIANRIIQAIQENKTEVNIGDDQIYSSAKKVEISTAK